MCPNNIQVDLFDCVLTPLMKIMRCFMCRKFLSVTREDDMRRSRRVKSSSLGIPNGTPRNIQEVSSVKSWGCPRHSLLHQQNYQVIFQDTIFLFLHMICVILGASIIFLSVLFCLPASNKWLDPSILVWRETRSIFSLEYSSFHSYCF